MVLLLWCLIVCINIGLTWLITLWVVGAILTMDIKTPNASIPLPVKTQVFIFILSLFTTQIIVLKNICIFHLPLFILLLKKTSVR